MSRDGDHVSDDNEETRNVGDNVVVDSTSTEELQARYLELLAVMKSEIAAAQRARAVAEAPEVPAPRAPPPATTPLARRKDKGKEVPISFSNSRDVLGRVDRGDFCDTDEQREYEEFTAREAVKEARRKKKAHDDV